MEILAHSQKNYTPAKNSWEDEEIKINFKFIIALEHIGANEQWSFWSTAHMEDCSLGLLHSFWFCYFCYRQSADDELSRSGRSYYISEKNEGVFLYLCGWFALCSWSFAYPLVAQMSGRFSRTIYVGNLPSDIREGEVEDLFYKVWFKCFILQYLIDVRQIIRFIHSDKFDIIDFIRIISFILWIIWVLLSHFALE